MAYSENDEYFQCLNRFVGRDEEKHRIIREWNRKILFGIWGEQAIGKSKFVESVLKSIRKETGTLEKAEVDLESVKFVEELVSRFSDNLSDTSSTINDQNYKRVLERNIRGKIQQLKGSGHFVLVIERCEDIVYADEQNGSNAQTVQSQKCDNEGKDTISVLEQNNGYLHQSRPLQTALIQLVKHLLSKIKSPRFKIILVSRIKFNFATLQEQFFAIELCGLTVEDGKKLLQMSCEPAQLSDDELMEVGEICEGHPLAIIVAGLLCQELPDRDSIKEHLKYLKSDRLNSLGDESLEDDERIGLIQQEFISTLPGNLKSQLRALSNAGIRFDKAEAEGRIGDDISRSGIIFSVLRPLLRRCAARHCPKDGCYSIQPFTREYMRSQQGTNTNAEKDTENECVLYEREPTRNNACASDLKMAAEAKPNRRKSAIREGEEPRPEPLRQMNDLNKQSETNQNGPNKKEITRQCSSSTRLLDFTNVQQSGADSSTSFINTIPQRLQPWEQKEYNFAVNFSEATSSRTETTDTYTNRGCLDTCTMSDNLDPELLSAISVTDDSLLGSSSDLSSSFSQTPRKELVESQHWISNLSNLKLNIDSLDTNSSRHHSL